MAENQTPYDQEEAINLRELIKTFLDYKWIIIVITFLFALIAILISLYVILPKYSSSSFVTLTEPIISAEFDRSIQVSPSMPETQALAEFAESDYIFNLVIRKLGLETYIESNDPHMEASLRGKSQLKLEVIDQDPKIAAKISNGWAEIMVQCLNEIYGTGGSSFAKIESEAEKAKQNWFTTQSNLEEYLPQSRINVIEVQLSHAKDSLRQYLNKIDHNQSIIHDAQSLDRRLKGLEPNMVLPLGESLSLIALQQRSSGGISGAELQIQGNVIFEEDFTVNQAKDRVEDLIQATEEQNNQLIAELPKIRNNITRLSVEIESEQHRLEKLTQERDLARNAYHALSNQLEEIRITEAQNGNPAKISARAVVPEKPSSPSVITNSLLALMTGLIISVSSIAIYEWWTNGNE